MHLVSLSKEISLFLNNLNDYLWKLIDDTPKKILINPELLQPINSIILFGNKSLYIDTYFHMYIEKLFSINKLNINEKTYVEKDKIINYQSSDHHFEFIYSDKYINFIKGIVSNENISGDQYIFYIKDIHNTTKSAQTQLVRLIDTSLNAKFIFTSNNLSLIDNAIKSRSLMINLSFNPEKIYACFVEIINKPDWTYEHFKKLYSIYWDDILQILNNDNNNLNLYEQSLIKLLISLEKEKNKYNVINNIRNFCYKIYHLNISYVTIAKISINYFKQHKSIYKIVDIFAQNESLLKKSNKELIIYEKTFFELYSVLHR